MHFYVIKLQKSFYWTVAALLVIGLFWYTDLLTLVDIPVSGVAPYYHGDATRPQMSLTINVDWGEEYIPLMLQILEAKGVRATFFVTGKWAGKYPKLVQQIHTAGHEIGNHGYSHAHPNQLTGGQMVEHLKKNEEILQGIIGVRTNLYAPPYGEYNKQVVEIAHAQGYRLIMWTADTVDWQRPTPQVIQERVLKKASNGGIVLMHPIQQTVQALPGMIDGLKARGYRLVTVSENLQQNRTGEPDGS